MEPALSQSLNAAKQPPPGMEQPRGGADLASEIVREVAERLRTWGNKGKLGRTSYPFVAIAEWLESQRIRTADQHSRCFRAAQVMLNRLADCRREKWLEYIVGRQTPWACWVDRSVPRTYEVLPLAGEGSDSLRTLAPARMEDLLALQRKWAGNRQEFTQLSLPLAHIGVAGIHALLQEALARRESVSADVGKAFDQLVKGLPPLHGGLPLSDAPRLRECLQILLHPREPLWGWGCLTWDCEVRLFDCLPSITAPYLCSEDFDQMRELIGNLLSWSTGEKRLPLEWGLEQLDLLGEAAERIASVLAPWPEPPRHRQWIACFLENLRRLGQLARCTRQEPQATAEPGPLPNGSSADLVVEDHKPEETAPVRESDAHPSRDGAAVRAEENAAVECSAILPQVDPLVEKPESPPPTAEEQQLAELARVYPDHVGSLEEIARLAVEMIDRTRSGWQEASHALEGLRAKCQQHREWLLKHTAGKPPLACEPVVKPRTVALTDELLNNLKQLDRLLPGVGMEGPLTPHSPAHLAEPQRRELCQRVKQVRDRLFDFMKKQGGYRLYSVTIGDTTIKHSGRLTLASPQRVFARGIAPDTVAQILQPGYVFERPPHGEIIKEYPVVRLAN